MSLTPEDAVEAVLALMDGYILRISNRVDEWPEDEQELHRNGDWHSFTERAQGVSRLRAEKIVAAVADHLAALLGQHVEAAKREAWDEGYGAGQRTDVAAETQHPNPYWAGDGAAGGGES